MPTDRYTSTERDAALYEARHNEPDRPTLAEAERDEAELAMTPTPEAVERILEGAPSITGLLIDIQQKVTRQIEAALHDTRVKEPAQAWLRTMLRTIHQEDWDEGVVGQFLRGEILSTIAEPEKEE